MEYRKIRTEDGSPTLELPPAWEHMHALEGAFTETQYIYRPTVEKAFVAVDSPSILSLGLGLAYNELLIAFEALRAGRSPERITSYESVDWLRESFRSWLEGGAAALGEVYEEILNLYAEKYNRAGAAAKALLLELLGQGGFELRGSVTGGKPPAAHAILFDPFSSKATPELWTPEFLGRFFSEAAARPCFVSTYAANGALKRALRQNGFTVTPQKGFGRKRESTFASRV